MTNKELKKWLNVAGQLTVFVLVVRLERMSCVSMK